MGLENTLVYDENYETIAQQLSLPLTFDYTHKAQAPIQEEANNDDSP